MAESISSSNISTSARATRPLSNACILMAARPFFSRRFIGRRLVPVGLVLYSLLCSSLYLPILIRLFRVVLVFLFLVALSRYSRCTLMAATFISATSIRTAKPLAWACNNVLASAWSNISSYCSLACIPRNILCTLVAASPLICLVLKCSSWLFEFLEFLEE